MFKINGRIFALWLAVVLALAPVLPVSTAVYAQGNDRSTWTRFTDDWLANASEHKFEGMPVGELRQILQDGRQIYQRFSVQHETFGTVTNTVLVQTGEIEYLLTLHDGNHAHVQPFGVNPFDVTRIRYSGRSHADSIVIILLGDGFTPQQYGTWPNPARGSVLYHADNMINTILSTQPFGHFADLLTVYVIHTVGNHPTNGTIGYLGTIAPDGDLINSQIAGGIVRQQRIRELANSIVAPSNQAMLQVISNASDGMGFEWEAWHYLLQANIGVASIQNPETPMLRGFNALITAAADPTFTITVQNGGVNYGANPNVTTQGALVTINAGTRDGYVFTNWITSPPGLTLANSNVSPTTFTMIGENVTVMANWDQIPPTVNPITNLAIGGVTPPVTGATPSTTVTGGGNQWTATVDWFTNNTPAGNTFSANTVYRAEITISPNPGWTLTGVANPGFTVAGATTVTRSDDVVTAVFPATAAIPPTFVPVTNITFGQAGFQTGEAVQLIDHTEIHPGNADFILQDIEWSIPANQPHPAVPVNSWSLNQGILTVNLEGNIRVRARIPNGRGPGQHFDAYFIITFTSGDVTVSHGLTPLYVGVPVNSNITFTLTGYMPTTPPARWQFADPITPTDFFVQGLPPGLTAGTPVRVNDFTVSIPVTGTPTTVASTPWTLTVPTHLLARNFRFATFNKTVTGNFIVGPVNPSAVIVNDAFTFDLNPHGEMHRDVLLIVELRGHILSSIRFGTFDLTENQDFFRFANGIMISSTFLSRMIVGTWEVTVNVTGAGANPVFHVTIIDSRVQQVLPPLMPPIDPGPFPTPPPTPHHPDATFIHLSGGQFVDIMNLNFAADRARVAPSVIRGEATTTIRADIFEEMALRLPGQRFEISTSLTRLFIPTDFLDIIHGARSAITASGLGTHQVDVHIRQIDRSNDQTLINRFNNVYPGGLILSPLAELRVELINSATGAVIFTASEFMRPLEMIHAVLQPGAHLRPAGMFFHPQRIEYAPFRTFSPNEVSIISRFTGVHGVMQNATHFIDLPLTHWAFEQAWTAAYAGIVIARGPFSFNTQISRGEFAQMLAFALQLPRAGITSSGFPDVSPAHPMFDGVSRLHAAGLTWLWDGGSFNPGAVITREEMAAIIASALVIGTPIRDPIVRPLTTTWPDGNQVSTRLVNAVQTTVNFELMIGYPDGTFRPHGPAIRGYATEVIVNAARLLGLLDLR